MHYSRFRVEDFVNDEYFRQWVLKPDDKNQKFWKEWLGRNPSKKNQVEQARKIVSQFEFHTYRPTHEETAEVWENIKVLREKHVSSAKLVSMRSHKDIASPAHVGGAWKVAAAVTLLFVSVLLLYSNREYILYKKFTTPYSQMQTVSLEDNTEVTLNANSMLKIRRSWLSRGSREVWLTGEAFFDVSSKTTADGESVEFLVNTNDLQVQVLGTQFSVNTRREKTRVVLTEGKVKLGLESSEEIYMDPGDMVEFSSSRESLKVQKVDPVTYTSWTENRLTFDGSTLKEIAAFLEDQHGLKITFVDRSLEEEKFRGTFEVDKIDVLLEAIAESFEIEIKKEDNEITMIKK